MHLPEQAEVSDPEVQRRATGTRYRWPAVFVEELFFGMLAHRLCAETKHFFWGRSLVSLTSENEPRRPGA